MCVLHVTKFIMKDERVVCKKKSQLHKANKTSVNPSFFTRTQNLSWNHSKDSSFLSYPFHKAQPKNFPVFIPIKSCSCLVQPENLEPAQSPDFGGCLPPLESLCKRLPAKMQCSFLIVLECTIVLFIAMNSLQIYS